MVFNFNKKIIYICRKCNNNFFPKQHNSKFCSNCKYYSKLKNRKLICKICNHIFIPTNSKQILCGNKQCMKQNNNNLWNIMYRNKMGYKQANTIKGNCIICGNIFLQTNVNNKVCRNKNCRLKCSSDSALKRYYINKSKILSQRKNDINYMIKTKLRMRVRDAVIRQKCKKAYKTMEILGCTIFEFRKYLEKQFKKGMNWTNYGRSGWVIDHIKPCCSFNLLKESEQKECFHYTNLQPLWYKENLQKSGKLNYENITN